MRKIFAALLIGTAVLAVTGCGGKSSEISKYVLITGASEEADDPVSRELGAGLEAYAAERGIETVIDTVNAADTDAAASRIKTAASEGAKYIISYGEDMGMAVWSAAGSAKKSQFLLFEAEPRKSPSASSEIKQNTECVFFEKESIGFLAGYMIVREGMRSAAWMSGHETEESLKYLEGLKNGIACGLADANLDASAFTLYTEYAGSDLLSPRRTSEAKALYSMGAGIILTDKPKIAEAVAIAAKSMGMPMATVGFDAVSSYDSVQFSAMPNISGAVQNFLAYFDDAKGFDGGISVNAGAERGAVRLSADYSRIPVATEVDVQTILGRMAAGEVVTDDDKAEGASPGSALNVTVYTPDDMPAAPSSGDAAAAPADSPDSGASEDVMVDMTNG